MRMRWLAAALFVAVGAVRAENDGRVLKVGIFENPPYAQKSITGKWEGLAVDLWELVAARNGWSYEYRSGSGEEIVLQLARGELDIAMGEIPISARLEEQVDLSQPFYWSHIGVAYNQSGWKPDWRALAKDLLNPSLFWVIGGITLGLILMSGLLWFFERRQNPAYRDGSAADGLFAGLWYATATLSTVGTGRNEPKTPMGILMATAWMVFSVIVVAAVSASVGSSVATAALRDSRTVTDDLSRSLNGVVRESLAESVLQHRRYRTKSYRTEEDALQGLIEGEVQTVVADRVRLERLNAEFFAGRFVIATTDIASNSYAILLRPGSPIREDLNITLLDIIYSQEWRTNLHKWVKSPGNTTP